MSLRSATACISWVRSRTTGCPCCVSAADAVVLPSEREGLANAWIEALGCGTPLVIPDIGGAREVVMSPAAGRIAARTPDAIAQAVASLIAAPPAQQTVG